MTKSNSKNVTKDSVNEKCFAYKSKYTKDNISHLKQKLSQENWNDILHGVDADCDYNMFIERFNYSSVARGRQPPLAETLPPFRPQMKLHFVQRSMESRHFESQSAPLLTTEPPLPPLILKSLAMPLLINYMMNAYR